MPRSERLGGPVASPHEHRIADLQEPEADQGAPGARRHVLERGQRIAMPDGRADPCACGARVWIPVLRRLAPCVAGGLEGRRGHDQQTAQQRVIEDAELFRPVFDRLPAARRTQFAHA
ncbi:hypothetical protein [Burkholderia cenocepacia]|uniref:hypothetical protein n=1 Tax=Burkholderia cenocepacia TaxID=95486 RepID=UPI001F46E53B|nr:hypothetical protein [Burkholderia cenocepacia]